MGTEHGVKGQGKQLFYIFPVGPRPQGFVENTQVQGL